MAVENAAYQQPGGPSAFHKKASERQSSAKGGNHICVRARRSAAQSAANFVFRFWNFFACCFLLNPVVFQVFSPAGAFQSTCRSDIWCVKDDMSRFKFPLRALKMLGERSMTQNALENN